MADKPIPEYPVYYKEDPNLFSERVRDVIPALDEPIPVIGKLVGTPVNLSTTLVNLYAGIQANKTAWNEDQPQPGQHYKPITIDPVAKPGVPLYTYGAKFEVGPFVAKLNTQIGVGGIMDPTPEVKLQLTIPLMKLKKSNRDLP